MTEEEKLKLAENNKHIPTEEIRQDIYDTQKEVKDYEDEKEVLMRNTQENRTRIYFIEGHISKRKSFIQTLETILEVRLRE